MPLLLYVSIFCVSYAILMLVFLNSLVMVLVSLPKYVNVAHFYFGITLGVLFILGIVLMFCISSVLDLIIALQAC
jgi:hypothetical protein